MHISPTYRPYLGNLFGVRPTGATREPLIVVNGGADGISTEKALLTPFKRVVGIRRV